MCKFRSTHLHLVFNLAVAVPEGLSRGVLLGATFTFTFCFFHLKGKKCLMQWYFFQILKYLKRLMLLSVDLMGFEAHWYLSIYCVYIFFMLNLEMRFRRY